MENPASPVPVRGATEYTYVLGYKYIRILLGTYYSREVSRYGKFQ